MKFFVLEYDREQSSAAWTVVEDMDEALALLGERERARAPHVEVVLLSARSLDDLRITHGRYFMDEVAIARQLRETLTQLPA